MTKIMAVGMAIWLAMTLGCEKNAEQAKSESTPAVQKDEHGHEADCQDGHENHEGEKHELGTAKLGEFEVSAVYCGTITPGQELDVDLALKGERGRVAALRTWIGTEDAKGSMKVKAAPEGEGYHAEVEVPEPMPAGAALWMEIETSRGETFLGTLVLKP